MISVMPVKMQAAPRAEHDYFDYTRYRRPETGKLQIKFVGGAIRRQSANLLRERQPRDDGQASRYTNRLRSPALMIQTRMVSFPWEG